MMMRTAKQQAHITIPDWVFSLGFEDQSWGNDLAARMTRQFPQECEPNEYTYLSLWVDHEVKEEREIYGNARLTLQVTDYNACPTHIVTLGQWEDEQLAKAMIAGFLTMLETCR